MQKINRDRISFYFLSFLFYSILGWIYEIVLEVLIYQWGYSDRGVLFGPYCPVYGFGALAFIFSLSRFKSVKIRLWRIPITPILSFIGIILIATGMELIASYLLEWTTAGWPWDYTRNWMNFEGRIAFSPSLRFGIGGMFALYLIQPLLEKLSVRIGPGKVRLVAGVLSFVLALDVIISVLWKTGVAKGS